MKYLFTSESVTEGHPDKICDQISDAVLDEILAKDPEARVACETLVCTDLVFVTGEITTKAEVNYIDIVKKTLADIGYTDPNLKFSNDSCIINIAINQQSPDISQTVTSSFEQRNERVKDTADIMGAGDQGIMFGYACDETPELMPYPIALAHKLALKLSEVRKNKTLSFLRPDGKTQVTIEYKDNKPYRIHTILISAQHSETVSNPVLMNNIRKYVIDEVLKDYDLKIDAETNIIINPSGRFVIGGPHGDAGLTGRKIIIDTYGGYAKHGGGAFSGKDPSKVDRSAAYMCRYVAKNIVAAKLAEKCEIQVSYAIGKARPISITAFTYGTGIISDYHLSKLIEESFDWRPWTIIENFQLKKLPQIHNGEFYRKTASYGHFGRNDLDLPWEKTDMVEELKKKSLKHIYKREKCLV